MQLEEITLALFAICNSIRIFAYVPQIHKAARDANGASAISGTTWSLFLVANISTIAHALINLGDKWLAICFAGYAVCCLAILIIAFWKKRRYVDKAVENSGVQALPGPSGVAGARGHLLRGDNDVGFATHALPWRA